MHEKDWKEEVDFNSFRREKLFPFYEFEMPSRHNSVRKYQTDNSRNKMII
jgi:hypothetical protein